VTLIVVYLFFAYSLVLLYCLSFLLNIFAYFGSLARFFDMRVIRGQTQYRLFLSVFIEFYMIMLALLDIDIEPKDVMAAKMETRTCDCYRKFP